MSTHNLKRADGPARKPEPGAPARLLALTPQVTIAWKPPRSPAYVAVANFEATTAPDTWRAVARVHETHIPLTDASLRTVGLARLAQAVRRLVKAGFVAGVRISPRCYLVSVPSLAQHLCAAADAMEAGKDFWTPARRERLTTGS